MKKYEFLAQLQKRLTNLPAADQRKTLDYYAEMIDERMDDGLTEEEAVAAIGTPKEIAAEILSDTPTTEAESDKPDKPRRKRPVWEILLLILGAPVWAPLLAAAVILLLAVIIVLASLALSLWAVDLALCAGGVALVLVSPLHFASGAAWSGLLCIGTGLFAAGLAIFLFYGCLQVSRRLLAVIYLIVLLTVRTFRDRLQKKEA